MSDLFSRRGFSALLIASAVMLGGAHKAAALETSAAQSFVEQTVDELRTVITGESDAKAGARKFLSLLETRSALDSVGKFAMGRNWREMTEAQQAAYRDAFRGYISRTYQKRFSEYAGEDIAVVSAIDAGKKGILVKSLLKRPNAESITVEWLVSDRSGRTLLSDVVFEGVSLAITLRETFGGMVDARNGDIDKFISDLNASAGA